MKLLSSLLIVGLLTGPTYTTEAKNHRDVVENAKKFTVLVTNEGFGKGSRGSGVLLDERHVLTCFHMLTSPKDELFVYTYPLGTVIRAHPGYVNSANDLAILVLDSSATVRVKPVFQVNYHDGEPITAIGNALGGMRWLVTGGVLSGEDRGDLISDAAINPGNSGGPWINEKGEILAITDYRISPNNGAPGVAGGVSAQTVQRFLASIEASKKMEAMLNKMFGA